MSEEKKDKGSNQDKINALEAELEELKAQEKIKKLNAEIDSLKKNTSTEKKDERNFLQKKPIYILPLLPCICIPLMIVAGYFMGKDIEQLVEKCSSGSSEACERLASDYQYRVVDGKRVAIEEEEEESPRFKQMQRITRCKSALKRSLKDPRSYKELNGITEQFRTGIIRYSATNSFGGRIQSAIDCYK
tara:strand:- start:270 stop:836 length:567 start_codon:yes stop_codon:yes gene_type:complete